MNADLVYSPYKPQKVHKYVGFGFGLHHTSGLKWDDKEQVYLPEFERDQRITLNMFVGGTIKVYKDIGVSTEIRFYPLFGGDLDESPIVVSTGISYDVGKTRYDSGDNKIAKYGCAIT